MLRKKLRNSAILLRTAVLGGLSAAFWPLLGRSVLYISMMNDATMAENKVFCKITIRDLEISEVRLLLTKKPIELVSPLKLSMSFLSLIFASDTYSLQYVADVSPCLATCLGGAVYYSESERRFSKGSGKSKHTAAVGILFINSALMRRI
jgi:hypothetical protein